MAFLSEQELRNAGLSEATIRTLVKLAKFVDQQDALKAAQTDNNANASSIADLNANDAALDARLDAIEALRPYVRQVQQAAPTYAPTYTAYAGQTVSALYVQAEAQATDDAVKALSAAHIALVTAFDDLMTALQVAKVLS